MEHGFENTYDGFPVVLPLSTGSLDDLYEGIPLFLLATADPPSKATINFPEDQATNISKQTNIDWTDGGNTFSYNVYFGTINPPVTLVASGGAASSFNPSVDLQYGTTYYWRIDSVNPYGTTTGDVWSFTTAPLTLANKATDFFPADTATGVGVQNNLSWIDGGGPAWYYNIPNTYNVYFGTTDTPTFRGNQAELSYEPGILTYEQLYFWRIDVVNPDGVQTGDLMHFFAAPQTPPGKATDPDPTNAQDPVIIQQYPALSWTPGAWSETFNVYIDTFNPPTTIRATVSEPTYTWPSLLRQTEYFWRIDCVNYDGTTPGDVWSFTTGPIQVLKELNLNEFADGRPLATTPTGTEQPLDEWEDGVPAKLFLNPAYGTTPTKVGTPSPPDESITASIFSILSWIDNMDYMNYDVYFGETNPPPFIGNQAIKSYDPGQLDYETLYYWRIDPIQEETGTGDVWHFTTLPVTPPSEVINPSPVDNLTDVAINKILYWTNGGLATSYDVYFGTESGNLTFIGNQAGTSYNPGLLDNDTEYFWRIDPVNFDGTTEGTEMSFTTRSTSFFVNPQRRNIIVVTS
jgi:hypothetical protein